MHQGRAGGAQRGLGAGAHPRGAVPRAGLAPAAAGRGIAEKLPWPRLRVQLTPAFDIPLKEGSKIKASQGFGSL